MKRRSPLLHALALSLLSMMATCTEDDEPGPGLCSTPGEVEPLECNLGVCHVLVDPCEAGPAATCPTPAPSGSDLCNDGFDNDCDGQVDEEDCPCESGAIKSCYSGSPSTWAIGTCQDGVQLCQNGVWSPCQDDVLPEKELCDGLDNDCDGDVDEGCPCEEGESQPCYGGPPGTAETGVCTLGVQTCDGGTWGDCTGDVTPQFEKCDGLDNDCNGVADDLDGPGDSCDGCTDGATQSCYLDGDTVIDCPVGLLGECTCGTQVCSAGQWGPCDGAVTPAEEECDGEKDEDCDGSVDNLRAPDGCSCPSGDVVQCYGGPPGSEQLGICSPGTQTCVDGFWSACEGQVTPQEEVCDGLDNDCNGLADDGVVDLNVACLTGLSGPCKDGKTVCTDKGLDCKENVSPTEEVCDGIDNNCDGLLDNGLFCCPDGLLSGNEPDIDCGGSCDTKCSPGEKCNVDLDCTSKVCVAQICKAPACNDSVKNGSETDIDCGGGICPKCPNGLPCLVGSDCISLVCVGQVCQVPVCYDGVKNGAEAGIDCGGPICPPCPMPATCNDGVKNGTEAGVDCGGPICPPCPMPATCNDGVKNGNETDVDCGGPSCPKCSDGMSCLVGPDCGSFACFGGVCQAPSCIDGVKNGLETDVDCGGGVCPSCSLAKSCLISLDCISLVCTNQVCQVPTCNDGVMNGNETDVDCGGPVCPACP